MISRFLQEVLAAYGHTNQNRESPLRRKAFVLGR